jgi:hypothetical protein
VRIGRETQSFISMNQTGYPQVVSNRIQGILADKRDIRTDIKDLKHDGVTLPKGKR